MINNNPYNIPEKPLKQSKVFHQNPPLFPHQINRRNEDEHKMQHHHLLKRSTVPYFVENSVSQVVRVPMSPQSIIKPQQLQMSNVTHWDNRQSAVHSITIWELNDKIQSISTRLQAQQRKLFKILDPAKSEKSTNLSNSTSLSQDTYYQGSKQLDKYQSNDESIDKIREEMSCFWNKSEKLNQLLREQMREQKQSITEQLLNSFKECLQDKFLEEQKKISEWMSLITNKSQQKLAEVKILLQDQISSFYEASQRKHLQIEEKSREFSFILKQKIEQTITSIDQFKLNFSQFKEEVLDNMVATQDHKDWLFQLDNKIKTIQLSYEFSGVSSKGGLKISSEYCFKQPFHLRYEQYISVAQRTSSKCVKSDERTYLIDNQGYLLDSNRFYILDKGDSRVKLTKELIENLKQHGYLQLSSQRPHIPEQNVQA